MIIPNLTEKYLSVRNSIPSHVTLVAVSKFHSVEAIQQVYYAGQRIFGENRVQEMMEKQPVLPKDVEWHFIGTLQSNKVKYIAPFVSLIHSVDSEKLLAEIDKQAKKNNRLIDCLLEVFIAKEESKHGFSLQEADDFLNNYKLKNKNGGALMNSNNTGSGVNNYDSIKVIGLMGMATNTNDTEQVRNEFRSLANLYKKHQQALGLKYLSMGMSNDYKIAIEEDSNMVRIGSSIFGK